MQEDRSASIFGNEVRARDYAKACRAKAKNARKFGDGRNEACHLAMADAPVIGERFGAKWLRPADSCADSDPVDFSAIDGPVVVGNIRMGYGHYRIAMAMASAAHALGKTPLWFDLMGFPGTAATKIISHQNELYSLGSRLSQKSRLFNSAVWEPLNSQGFRKLSYNASDQKTAELMVGPYADLPRDVPFVATHAWCAQAAVHAGLTQVVNAIPDNWPMALHLAEGALHTVQTPSALWGYRALRGMDRRRQLAPMPQDAIAYVGHYVDHELVLNIPFDCAKRVERAQKAAPVRYVLTVGGAGAQFDLFKSIIEHLMPYVERDEAALLVNVGDHGPVWGALKRQIPALAGATEHFNNFDHAARFAEDALEGEVHGVHAFGNDELFAAVYTTNLLMRAGDLLVTKPSELSFYPVPKLMITRVGGHEAWGAVRAAEVGDGTYELESAAEANAWIDLVQHDRSVVADMCANIESADMLGTYDGAYHAVMLASDAANFAFDAR